MGMEGKGCRTHNYKCPYWTPSEVLVSKFKILDPDIIKHKLTFKKQNKTRSHMFIEGNAIDVLEPD